MVKVTLDRAQSGGDQITITDNNGVILRQARIETLPKKDGIVIIDTSRFVSDLEGGKE